ncbi:IclR family transcriptional regulator [Jiella sonneratiae]|uniref:IclR family transcriptional regulator n=1 Tax=Jiella sonneratiae TaxID=2816856 RepID=A0ABS3J253_9HYPH|nr:IclR family transcriptional regulator [Jiella sonneratiae]MBO0903766.1 IclR family transcriptional regulator [Jiella sonneratiae]
MAQDGARSGTQSIERAFAILRLVAANSPRGLRLTDLTREMGLPASTLHRILKTLQDGGLIERSREGRRYIIGSELTLLGLSSPMRHFRELASGTLRSLSDQVGDAVFLSVRSDADTVCVDRKIGDFPIQVLSIEIGSRRPLGISANGAAMLSRMTTGKAAAILDQNADRLQSFGVERAVLMERIAAGRTLGYVQIRHAIVEGTSALAVPILDVLGQPVAAISTIAIAWRQPDHRIPLLIGLLQAAAAEISTALIEDATRRR